MDALQFAAKKLAEIKGRIHLLVDHDMVIPGDVLREYNKYAKFIHECAHIEAEMLRAENPPEYDADRELGISPHKR
jgi:hypothetical protein